MKKLIVFLCTLGIFACKTNTIVEPPANEFVGTWKLVSYCRSSTPTCTSIVVPTDKGVFISFANDQKFSEFYTNVKPIEHAFLGCGGGSYKIEGSSLRITALCMSSSSGQSFPIKLVDEKRLVLSYYFGNGEYVFERQ
jgi:hypothetical protein